MNDVLLVYEDVLERLRTAAEARRLTAVDRLEVVDRLRAEIERTVWQDSRDKVLAQV